MSELGKLRSDRDRGLDSTAFSRQNRFNNLYIHSHKIVMLNARTALNTIAKRFATHLGGGSTKNGRTSHSKRLGVKRGNNTAVSTSEILVRQRGYQWHPGRGVVVGRDHTLNAAVAGRVRMERDVERKKTIVHVEAEEIPGGRRGFDLQDITTYL